MAKLPNSIMGKRKHKSDLSAYPLSTQMRIVIDRMVEQKIDPLEAVIKILDPNHDEIVKPTLRPEPRIPNDTNKGIFRVIYSEVEGKRRKLRTHDIEASDGYDAVNKFLAISDNRSREKKHEIIICGMECVIIPSKVLKDFRNYWSDAKVTGEINTLMQAAHASLIAELELFEDESKTRSIEDFIMDDD